MKGTECLGNPLPLLREERNVPKNVVFGDNAEQSGGVLAGSQALGPNAITLPARRATEYISEDVESDVDSMYDSYKIFTPDDTEDEKPKRKVVFSNTNRFFFVDDDGNQERVDLRANLGDKVMGRCKATVCPAARSDSGCGISSPSPRWLEPTPPRCDGICHMCMYSRTHNALGTRCLYSLRVDYTSQNSHDFIHYLRLLRDPATYTTVIPR